MHVVIHIDSKIVGFAQGLSVRDRGHMHRITVTCLYSRITVTCVTYMFCAVLTHFGPAQSMYTCWNRFALSRCASASMSVFCLWDERISSMPSGESLW